jgi:hypothetical protein
MRTRALLAGFAVLWLCASGTTAQPVSASLSDDGGGPIPAGRPPEWSFSEGFGFTLNVNRGRSHEVGLYAHPGVSFRLSSRFEYLVEGHFCHFVSPGGYMVGLMPIGGRISIGRGLPQFYATFGMGAGWTNLAKLDEIDQRFNFLLQTGGRSGAIFRDRPGPSRCAVPHLQRRHEHAQPRPEPARVFGGFVPLIQNQNQNPSPPVMEPRPQGRREPPRR